MLSLHDLSFRYKIPLRSSVLVIVTAVILTSSIIFREYDEMKEDLMLSSASMGRVLANTLVGPMLHEDVWRAFEILNSAFQPGSKESFAQTAETVLVLDPRHRVYVSTQPTEYPMLSDPGAINGRFVPVLASIKEYRDVAPRAVEIPGSSNIYMVAPITSDGVSLGVVLISYSKTMFLPRFFNIAKRSALITFLVLALLLPASWYWAHRMAIPLVKLADCMGKIPGSIPENLECQLYESKDEVGQVGVAFKRMFAELKNKEYLEKQVAASERLAAVGRLSAGIAHEINNPLGGMLNALNTFKRHGGGDTVSIKTASLLERGLLQIRDIVAALLVEAKVGAHPLSRQDIEDTKTLVLPNANKKRANFVWENDIVESLPLASTLVRQITINLLLNAIQAIEEKGNVYCHVFRDSNSLHMVVKNDGQHIPQERMEHLFEPFSHQSESGHGLGLWTTYQAVQQMAGEITVNSSPGDTCFTVTLPLGRNYDQEPIKVVSG